MDKPNCSRYRASTESQAPKRLYDESGQEESLDSGSDLSSQYGTSFQTGFQIQPLAKRVCSYSKDKYEAEKMFQKPPLLSESSFEKAVLMHFKDLKEQNKIIIEQNRLILKEFEEKHVAQTNKLSECLMEPLAGFPMNAFEQFVELNSKESLEMRKKLCKHLVQMGSSKLREFLNLSLKEIMTDEFVCKFSWPGGENHFQFGDTRVSNILYQAAQQCTNFRGPDDKAQFKSEMLEALRTTKQRHRNSLKKQVAKSQTVVEMDEESLKKKIASLEALAAEDCCVVESLQSHGEDSFDGDDESD